MAMRRRIKVGVNLTAAKRKLKTEPNENSLQEVEENISSKIKSEGVQSEPSAEVLEKSRVVQVTKTEPDADVQACNDGAFKCPPKVEFIRSNSHTVPHGLAELNNHSEIDDGAQVMQMDLQRTGNGFPMSPSKTQQRQRIKPTPKFGQRRNSLVGPTSQQSVSSHDSDTTEQVASPQRRERHFSGSQNFIPAHNHANAKTSNSTASGRIRTESTCSVFSDSYMSTSSKSRKADDTNNTHRSQARRDFEARFLHGVPEKSNLKMFDLIYYNPVTNPMEHKPKIEQLKKEAKEEIVEHAENTENEGENNENSLAPVPQLKLNAKGELILDDKSLEIETTAEQEARKVLAKSSLIYLDENTGMNGFYKRQKRTREWPADETIRFYRCLKTIGTDFSMMCQLFPKRTRRDLKLKFKKEERCNGALINKALLHPNSFDIQDLKDQFEIEDRQREEEAKRPKKTIKYRKINVKTSKSARALKNADDIYKHELGELEKTNKKQRKERKTNKNEEKKRETKNKTKRRSKKTNENEVEDLTEDVQHYTSQDKKIKNEFVGLATKVPTFENSAKDQPQPTQTEDFEQTNILPTNDGDNEYDENRFHYFDDSEEELNPTDDSRTFVNMDNGNVTLIKDSETLTTNASEQEGVQIINPNNVNEISSIPIVYGMESPNCFYPNFENDLGDDNRHETKKMKSTSISPTANTTNMPYTINDEAELAKILEDIAKGSLVVVSTFNPGMPDDTVNEIYMLDENTGELCDEPLDLPQEIIQSILSVMT